MRFKTRYFFETKNTPAMIIVAPMACIVPMVSPNTRKAREMVITGPVVATIAADEAPIRLTPSAIRIKGNTVENTAMGRMIR